MIKATVVPLIDEHGGVVPNNVKQPARQEEWTSVVLHYDASAVVFDAIMTAPSAVRGGGNWALPLETLTCMAATPLA